MPFNEDLERHRMVIGPSPEDVERVRASLRSVAQGANRVLGESVEEASLAAAALGSELNGWLPTAAQGYAALYSAKVAAQTTVDCASAFVDLLLRGQRSVALAPLVRTGVEAAAKTLYLLSASDERELMTRHAAVVIDELKFPVRHSKFQTLAGHDVDGPSHRSELTEALGKLTGGSRFEIPTTSQLVADVLSVHSNADPAIYSQLSGVTHAATSALSMFVEPSSGSLLVPRTIVVEYAAYLFACVVVIAEETLRSQGLVGAVRERWEAAKYRGWVPLRELRDSLDR